MAEISWTYAVSDPDLNALEGVHVWATSDRAGKTVLDSGTTDSSGEVTLSLEENSQVFMWQALNGYTPEDQPNLQTVTDGVTGSGSMTANVAAVPDAVTKALTARDLITDAFREVDIIGDMAPLLDHHAAKGLRLLNTIIERWRLDRRLVYVVLIDRHTLTANQASFTIGPSGDFLADRPIKITKGNIVITGGSIEERHPLEIIETAEEWGNVSSPDDTGDSLSDYLFYQQTFPDGTLYLYPYPTLAYDLELFTWKQLAKFKSLDHQFEFPDGYYDALMLSVAERLCIPYGVPLEVRSMIQDAASEARADIKSINVQAPMISTIDSGMPTVE